MLKLGGKISLLLGIFLMCLGFAPSVQAAGTISGTVTDAATGLPLEDLYIYAEVASTGTVATYDLTDVNGAYTLSVDAEDYVVYNLGNTTDNVMYIRSISPTITVAEGAAIADVDLSLDKRGRIIGHVYASDGVTPLNDVVFSVYNQAGYANGYSYGSSNADGSFYLSPYISADYTSSAAGIYYAYISNYGYFSLYESNLIVRDGEDTTVNFTLNAKSTLSGTITDINGIALKDVLITAYNRTTGHSYLAATNASGYYTVQIYDTNYYNQSAIGNYTLTFVKDDYITKVVSVSISSEETGLTSNDYSLNLGGVLSGKVYAKDGVTALENATVSAIDGYGNTYTTTTASDGSYSLSGLTGSDKYEVSVSKTGYVSKKKYDLEVTAGQLTSVTDFKLKATVTFNGTVAANSAGLNAATLELYSRDKTRSNYWSDYSITTVSDGSFTLENIIPGKYRVRISKSGYILKEIDKLNLNADVLGKNYNLTAGAEIFGTVTYNGDPVSGAPVYAYAKKNASAEDYMSTTTDNDGNYKFTELSAGKYYIKISATEYVLKIKNKSVTAGAKKTVDFTLKKGGHISGYLRDAVTDLPLSLTIRVKGTAIYGYSNSNGYYIIDGLAAGTYTLQVENAWYETVKINDIVVTAGDTTENVNFTLIPK